MVLGLVGGGIAWLVASALGYKALRLAGGDPEGDLATEIAKTEGRKAYLPAMEGMQARHDLYMSQQMGTPEQDLMTKVGMTRAGWEDEEIAGNSGLVDQISAQVGLSPAEIRQRLNPGQVGASQSLTKAAFGRAPIRGNR